MKTLFVVLGVLALLVGVVWILQGTDILMGSFMSGNSFWLAAGVVAALLGLGLVALGARAPGAKKPA
ncbi:MAG TPA: hypothetical protein VEY12_00095 [Thermoplasmata archaeon]|nr:hypothetical protein [Thermoplasmata archaeon]